MAQTPAAVVSEQLSRAEGIPLLDPASPGISSPAFEVSTSRIEPHISVDKSPLPFEEVPGPAVLKIWEKYWKYVPLLGTQLFSSLLINRFTQGTIC